jgi:manganese/zinc/iron transport system substrate-binding protein
MAFLAGVVGVGCSSHDGPPPFDGSPVRIVCTTTLVADVVQRVGGDRVTVETLMRANVDPHRYLATAGDTSRMSNAHLVLYNGLHLEGKMTDTLVKMGSRIRAHAVTKTIDPAKLRAAEVDGTGDHDPHVWFDVKLWMNTVICVRDVLSEFDPAGKGTYWANAAKYLTELDELDNEIRQSLEKVPPERRVLVTSHDAFGYFGRSYGFEVIGLQGVSTASETGVKNRADLAAVLGKRKIPAVFTETSVPEEGLKSVLETCLKDWKHEVQLVGGDNALYSDALGEPGTATGTYPGMIRHNVRVIVGALTK